MNGEKEEVCILLWSREDIKIDNEDLDLMIQRDAPGAKIQIVNLWDLTEMEVSDLKRLMDGYSEKSVLIISSSEEPENMDFWKLGFIMGKVSAEARIIGFVKSDRIGQTKCFKSLRDLLLICESEIKVKSEIKTLMKGMGIETKFDLKEYTAGRRAAGKAGF